MKKALVSVALILAIAFSAIVCIPIRADVIDSGISKAPMQQARASPGIAVVGGYIYAIGGNNVTGEYNIDQGFLRGIKGGTVNIVEQYNPATDNWIFKAPMPTSRDNFAVAVYQNKIYCIGGRTSIPLFSPQTFTTINEVYDPETNIWQTKTPMPNIEFPLQASVVNGKIYVIGHSGGIYTYDPATDSWLNNTKGPEPDDRGKIQRLFSATFDNKIYIIGLNFNDYIYDPSSDIWNKTLSTMPRFNGPEGLLGYGTLEASGGITTGILAPERIYLFFNDQTFIYNPFNDSWGSGTGMHSQRVSCGVAILNDTFYLIGGSNVPQSFFDLYAPSAVNEQYFPVAYGTPDPSYVLEHYPPTVSVLAAQNQTFNDSKVSLELLLDKPVTWIDYSLDEQQNITAFGNKTLTNDTTTNITITNVTSGFHNLVIYANDTYGNVGTQTYNFTVALPSTTFPTVLVAAGITVVIVALALVVYLKRYRR